MTIGRMCKIILFTILAGALAFAIPALYDKVVNLIFSSRYVTASAHGQCPSAQRQVAIYDQTHQATLILYRPAQTAVHAIDLPLRYARNIQAWFKDPAQAQIDQGYEIPGSKKYYLTKIKGYDPVLLHAFSKEVDQYLPCWSQASFTMSKKYHHQRDQVFIMRGLIQDRHNKHIPGSFTYIFDAQSGICYHRFFQPQRSGD